MVQSKSVALDQATAGVTTALSQPTQIPGLLRHLHFLTRSFVYGGRRVSYIGIYAAPHDTNRSRKLETIAAQDSGFEGIACVDDVARAAILGLRVFEQTGSGEALRLARAWLRFVAYMQEADGRFTNFILDESGAKNRGGRTSRTGGQWWTARAMWALATAWRVTSNPDYLRVFELGHFAPTIDMKKKAVHALALTEIYGVRPDTALLARICTLCDAIVSSGSDYFRDVADGPEVAMWGYHQLEAVARAGRLFSRLDYLTACETTVQNLIEPVIEGGFYHVYPHQQDHQCAYDISTLASGLTELYRATGQMRYRDLALECIGWFDGHNLSKTVMYDPDTGRCSDGITNGEASLNCGAESAIEAGSTVLLRNELRSKGNRPRSKVAAKSARPSSP